MPYEQEDLDPQLEVDKLMRATEGRIGVPVVMCQHFIVNLRVLKV